MSRTAATALCSAMPVPHGTVPDWIHLLPAGTISTQDGRGPYTVADMPALAAAINAGGKLPLDECHSTDLAAPTGNPAPARGWIVESEARADGLWGRVEWTRQGRELMEDGAYNGISPVILHDRKKTVVGVLRASLTNAPNLKGLTALHSQEPDTEGPGMDWKARIVELLKLDEAADDAAIEAALAKALEAKPETATHGRQDITEHPAFKALQSELADAVTSLNAQGEATKRKDAEAFVDGAIAEGRVGVKAARDMYVQMHAENPARAEALVGALPILKSGTVLHSEIAQAADESGLDAGDRQVMALMGLNEDDYKASRQGSAARKEAL